MNNFEQYKLYYSILNIPYDADINSIKKSFRSLSLKYHPDKCNNNSVDYNKIIHAYEKLNYLFENNSYNDIISAFNLNKSKNTDESDNSENYQQSDNSQKMKQYQSSKILTDTFFQNLQNFNNDNNYNNYNKFLSNIETTIDITFENSYFGKSIPIQINRNIFKNNVISNEIETLYI